MLASSWQPCRWGWHATAARVHHCGVSPVGTVTGSQWQGCFLGIERDTPPDLLQMWDIFCQQRVFSSALTFFVECPTDLSALVESVWRVWTAKEGSAGLVQSRSSDACGASLPVV